MKNIINWLLRPFRPRANEYQYAIREGGSWFDWPGHLIPPTKHQLTIIAEEAKGKTSFGNSVTIERPIINTRRRFAVHPTFVRWWGQSQTHCLDFCALKHLPTGDIWDVVLVNLQDGNPWH